MYWLLLLYTGNATKLFSWLVYLASISDHDITSDIIGSTANVYNFSSRRNNIGTRAIHHFPKAKEMLFLMICGLLKDNGLGIRENELSKIFDMYGRLQEEIEGQGIGLYLAKKIVNAAGGKITVESEPGRGSRFMIYLKNEVDMKSY